MSNTNNSNSNSNSPWEAMVISEINDLLDIFVPVSQQGSVILKYTNPEKERTEASVVYDEDKAKGVKIILDFEFNQVIDIPKELGETDE